MPVAKLAILFKLHSVGMVLLLFGRVIISPFTLLTRQRYHGSHDPHLPSHYVKTSKKDWYLS